MKLIWNNNNFPLLSVCSGKLPFYGSRGVIINYHYMYDQKLVQVVVVVRIINYSFHSCQKQLIITWY